MNKELLALLEKINSKKVEVKNLVSDGKIEEASAAKEELVKMQKSFDILKDMTEEEPVNKVDATPAKTGDSFANQFRNLPTNTMKEGVDENGGLTVPQDIQTKINQYKENHRSFRDLVTVEPVSTNKGSRVYQTRTQVQGFGEVAEDGSIEGMTEPTFEQKTYAVKDYAGYLPVTNDLLNDSDANIEGVIVDWIGRNSLATDNKKVLALAQAGTPEAATDLDDIKKAVIVDIGSAYDSVIVTNDSGLAWLDTQKDTNQRYLLQPNPSEPAQMQLRCGAKVVPIEVFSDDDFAPKTTGKIPFIVGDLKEAFHIYDREQTTIYASRDAMVTDGEGKPLFNAFAQRGCLYRGEIRCDYRVIDQKAFKYLELGE